MFHFRPYASGFNVQPPAEDEVPGFRMTPDGALRTDVATPSRPPAYTSVGWTPNADAYGNAETAVSDSYGPSYWSDVRDGVGKLGHVAEQFAQGANATVNGAYSLLPGMGNLARAAGRGLGLYGSEEAQRFRQEMDAAWQGVKAVAQNPRRAGRLAYEGGRAAIREQPLVLPYLGGRAGMGILLGLEGLPVAPFAMLGDAFHALEEGHNAVDAGLYGLFGVRPGGR